MWGGRQRTVDARHGGTYDGRTPSSEACFAPVSPEQLAAIREKDHRRIAYDLHDGPAQVISRALFQLEVVESMAGSGGVAGEVAELRKLMFAALDDIQGVIRQLRPHCVDSVGLVEKVRRFVRECSAWSDDDSSISVTVIGDEPELSESAEITLFRIVQEALNNAVKHSRARRITVLLKFAPDDVCCVVSDDGVGFSFQECINRESHAKRYGLIGMRERAELEGGFIDVDTAPGKGAIVTAQIPVWQRQAVV